MFNVALHKGQSETFMTGPLTFAVAVGLASAACYALLVRADRMRGGRRSSSGSAGCDVGGPSGNDYGFHFGNWFSNTSIDVMGNPIDGGGDGGGESGGGGGGDGGGGGGD